MEQHMSTFGISISSNAWGEAMDVNPGFRRSVTIHLPLVLDRFAEAAVDYGDASDELGIKAQFVDINRKIGKLKRFMWEGKPLRREQVDEVISDLIAHLLLTLDLLSGPGQQEVVNYRERQCSNPSCLMAEPHANSAHRFGG